MSNFPAVFPYFVPCAAPSTLDDVVDCMLKAVEGSNAGEGYASGGSNRTLGRVTRLRNALLAANRKLG